MTAMAVETRPELVGKRFLCLALGEEARLERGESGRCWRGWRAGVIRAVSHRDSRNPDLAVRARAPLSPQPAAAAPLVAPPPHCVGLPLAPGSAGPTGGHAPLLRSWAGSPTFPAGVSTSPTGSFSSGGGDPVGFPGARQGRSATVRVGFGRGFPCGAPAAAETFRKGGAASLAPHVQVGAGAGRSWRRGPGFSSVCLQNLT